MSSTTLYSAKSSNSFPRMGIIEMGIETTIETTTTTTQTAGLDFAL
jgi:hypothetical protein